MAVRHALAVSLLVLSACTTPDAASPVRSFARVPACPADATVMQGWDDRAPPRKVFGNTWYVGSCGLSALLVTSPQGHVLIDGATEAAAPHIEANIRLLGFRPEDVRYLLNSHEHSDHAGGLAHLQRVTGATLMARTPAVAALRRGKTDRGDPQYIDGETFPPIVDVKPVEDGATLRLGELALTPHATPGHTPGGTTWTWRSCDAGRCLEMAYTDSVSAISDKQYRYSDHPAYVAAFRSGLDNIASLACDIHITPHPLASNLFARLDGKAPLIDPTACKRYAATGRENLAARLQAEHDGTAP